MDTAQTVGEMRGKRQSGSDSSGAPEELRIQLLGGFRVTVGAYVVHDTAWRLQKARSLVKLLALAPGHRLHRERVMDQLWPAVEPEAAANNLYYALHVARSSLAAGHLSSPASGTPLRLRQQILALEPAGSLLIDVEAFEEAASAALRSSDPLAYEAALALYTGDLLPDDRYEDWAAARRETLRATHLGLLLALARLHEAREGYSSAIAALQRVVAAEPAHEPAHAGLMRLYAVTGQRHQALRQYEQLQDALRRELDTEPDASSRQLYLDVLAGKLTAAPPAAGARATLAEPAEQVGSSAPAANEPIPRADEAPPISEALWGALPRSPLVGRARDLERLQAAWESSAAGGPHLAVIVGEAGIGKTRLAKELLAWAGRRGTATATARCFAAEGELAYAPIATWLRTEALWPTVLALDDLWLTEVGRVVPEVLVERPDLPRPGPLTESWQRQRLFEALTHALFKSGRPLLLLVDDLQWGDHETLEWLSYVLRCQACAPVLVVGTLRPEETGDDHPVGALLAELRRRGQLTEIELSPLDATETATLAANVAGQALDAGLAARLYAETEGNPLFVVETVRADLLGQWREACTDSATAASLALGLPPTVQAVIDIRLAQLSPSARKLAGLAAVIGREFSFELLAQASARDEDSLVEALEELRQRRIVREREAGAYDFSHDKLRQGAYAGLSVTRRRLLHRRVAQALEVVHAGALDEVSGQLATHYLQAGEAAKAIAYLERAGDQARALYANAEAEGYYHTLVARLDALGRSLEAAQAREKLGAAVITRARYDEALAILTRAAETYQEIGDLEGEVRVAAQMSWAHTLRCTAEEGWALVQRLVDLSPIDRLPARTQVTLYDTLAQLHFRRGCYDDQLAAAERAAALARAVGDDVLLSRVEMRRGTALVHLGRCDEALEALEGAIPLAGATGELWDVGQALNYAGLVYLFRGEFEQDRRYIQRGLELAERKGDLALVAYMTFRRAMPDFYARQWDEARTDLERSALLYSQLGLSWLSASPLLGLGLLDMAQGQGERGAAYLQEVVTHGARAGEPGTGMAWFARGALAERDLLAGHPQAARDWLAPLRDLFAQQRGDVVFFLPLAAWTDLDLGDETQADQWVDQTLTRAGAMGYRATVAEALRVRAMAALRRGDWPAAVTALEEALALERGIPDPYDEAKTLWVYGRLHLAQGEPEQARERLEAALAILERLGERLYAEHVERALAELEPR